MARGAGGARPASLSGAIRVGQPPGDRVASVAAATWRTERLGDPRHLRHKAGAMAVPRRPGRPMGPHAGPGAAPPPRSHSAPGRRLARGLPIIRKNTVRLPPDVAHRVRAGHPWVYREALGPRPLIAEPGAVIDCIDE